MVQSCCYGGKSCSGKASFRITFREWKQYLRNYKTANRLVCVRCLTAAMWKAQGWLSQEVRPGDRKIEWQKVS